MPIPAPAQIVARRAGRAAERDAAEPAEPSRSCRPGRGRRRPATSRPARLDPHRRCCRCEDLGANSPIRLIGVQGEGSLPFSVRRDEVVTGGKMDLTFAYSPALIPELSHLTVLLNGEVLGSIPLPKEKAIRAQTASLPINPVLFQEDNRVLFRFIGHYTLGCEDPLHSSLWLVLSNTSKLTMQLRKAAAAPTICRCCRRRSTTPRTCRR